MAIQIQPHAPELARKLATLLEPIDPDKAAALLAQAELPNFQAAVKVESPEALKEHATNRPVDQTTPDHSRQRLGWVLDSYRAVTGLVLTGLPGD